MWIWMFCTVTGCRMRNRRNTLYDQKSVNDEEQKLFVRACMCFSVVLVAYAVLYVEKGLHQ